MMNETMMTQEQYNAVALAQVETDGDKCEETCPDCGKLAVRHDFECCHSGSVNAHYTLNCSHCGYHECDQDTCSICDEAISLTRHHYDEAAKWVTFFDSIEECLMNGRGVPGLLWTEFKHVVHQQPEVVDWLDTFLDLEGVNAEQLILHFKQQMVKIRFDLRFN